MRLQSQLDAFLAFFRARVPCDRAEALERNTRELCSCGGAARALKVGDAAADFQLPDIARRPVSLAGALRRGPVVLLFYRGGWCPYCSITLRAWQEQLPAIARAGATLLAVSPQTVAASAETARANGLDFPLLSDHGARVAAQYGLDYELPASMHGCFTALGHALPERNGTDDWRLPIPATFIILPDQAVGAPGRIVHAHVDPDYRRREDPADVLAALRQVVADAAA